MIPSWWVISFTLVFFQNTFIFWQGSNYVNIFFKMFLVSLVCIQERKSSFDPVILENIWCYIIYNQKQYLEIRFFLPFLENDGLEHILFYCLHYIKNSKKYKFSFNVIGKMWCDFLNLKDVAKKINFSIFELYWEDFSISFQTIWMITFVNLGIKKTNKIN